MAGNHRWPWPPWWFPSHLRALTSGASVPLVIAVTYSGALNQTWGCSAAYDAQGNIYTGGMSFGPGYPATMGSFQIAYNGLQDIAISKLNTNGTALIYATYLGGGFYEIPQSLVVNNNNELCIYGLTGSPDFPTTTGCYRSTFNGGDLDIVITHLNATGSALMGSTYIGGNASDGSINAVISLNYTMKSPGEILWIRLKISMLSAHPTL